MSAPLFQIRARPTGPRAPAAGPGPGSAREAAADAPRAYVETYGCQMNVSDSAMIAGQLARGGYLAADDVDRADVVLINTCAVRDKAEERVFARLGELAALRRRRPDVVLGVIGCMAEHLRDGIAARAPHVDLLVGPDAYRRLPDLVARARARRSDGDGAGGPDDPLVDVRLDRRETYEGVDPTRVDEVSGFVTIQRGCDKFCTFCVVPFTRGRERGVAPREVLRQVRVLAEAGARQVTLLGQTVNSYRFEDVEFSDLLRAVVRVDGIERVRFTSPYPMDFTPRLIETLAAEPKLCKHVHLPLQSGADAVLARMRRGYDRAGFAAIAAALRAAMPEIAITTDLIVGFSGETDGEFRATLDAVRELQFDAAFTFAYSERERTYAARALPDDVPAEVKGARLRELIATQSAVSAKRHARLVGTTQRVLVEGPSRRDPARLVGRDDGFHPVVLPPGVGAVGALLDVTVRRATSRTLFA